MTYEQARANVDYLVNSAICTSVEYPKGMTWEQLTTKILESLLTPAQLEAWKDGGELVVTDPDQSLPDSSTNKYPDKNKLYALIAIKWYNRGLARLLKNKWMKVVSQQSGGE